MQDGSHNPNGEPTIEQLVDQGEGVPYERLTEELFHEYSEPEVVALRFLLLRFYSTTELSDEAFAGTLHLVAREILKRHLNSLDENPLQVLDLDFVVNSAGRLAEQVVLENGDLLVDFDRGPGGENP